MQNIPPQTVPSLLPPEQLWPNKPGSGTASQPPPSQNQVSGLSSPDQLRQLMSNQKSSLGAVAFINPPSGDLKSQLGQLQTLMQKADAQALLPYGVVVQSNAQGQITGYLLHGKPATAEQVQQHLLPMATRLHKELLQIKAAVDQEYFELIQRVQGQLKDMTPVEQNAVRIQLQAIQSVYQGFLNRLIQVDNLIK